MKGKKTKTLILICLAFVVALALYFGTFLIYSNWPEKAQTPARINITLLGIDCNECSLPTINETIEFLQEKNDVELTSIQEFGIKDSGEIAARYQITNLPAVVITGEIDSLNLEGFNKVKDALVLNVILLPYYDLNENKVVGSVNILQIVDSTCDVCYNISLLTDKLSHSSKFLYGVINSTETVYSDSSRGKAIIDEYKIKFLPALVFNKEVLEYEFAKDERRLKTLTVENDGKVVLRLANPPYRNLSTGKIEGLIRATLIVDKNCADCYNASITKDGLSNLYELTYSSVKEVDVSSNEGKLLIKKYAVELVPTIILSKEAGLYVYLPGAWAQWGTKENDGSFVFRNISVWKNHFAKEGKDLVYRNLTSGEKIEETFK